MGSVEVLPLAYPCVRNGAAGIGEDRPGGWVGGVVAQTLWSALAEVPFSPDTDQLFGFEALDVLADLVQPFLQWHFEGCDRYFSSEADLKQESELAFRTATSVLGSVSSVLHLCDPVKPALKNHRAVG